MTTSQQILIIALMVVTTVTTRALPFILFPPGRVTPKYIKFLGNYLPLSVFAMLVVYCLKDIQLSAYPHGTPELIGIIITIVLHLWRRQMLLSIAGGTISYMLLVQYVFV